MNVGMIVYSQSGHTLKVARKLEQALSDAGHAVTLERIQPVGLARPGLTDVPLKVQPKIDGYEALVLGTPVWGGTPASPMASYLAQLASLQGKRVVCLVTGFFPASWGRNQALAQLRATCEEKGATVRGTGSVGWWSFQRKRQIAEVVEYLSGLLQQEEASAVGTLAVGGKWEDGSMTELKGQLKGGVFLSSMMGVTDGAFCARTLQGKHGVAMVQTGAYLAEPTATDEDKGAHGRSFLPAGAEACAAFLAADCRSIQEVADVAICMNLATPKLEWGLEAAECFAQAGGDAVELNVHGGYGRYLEQGKLRAMVRPEHQDELLRWVAALVRLDVPLIVKYHGGSERAHLVSALRRMANLPVLGVHVNVRDEATKRPDVELVRALRTLIPGLFMVSGYVRSPEDAEALFAAGADMVGVAAPVREDPAFLRRITAA
jgi:tRNA-dihydrouridine synthase/flavodoxin